MGFTIMGLKDRHRKGGGMKSGRHSKVISKVGKVTYQRGEKVRLRRDFNQVGEEAKKHQKG